MIYAVLTAGLGVVLYAVIAYNLLIRDRSRVRAAWSDIDVQLKRRHDLLTKLVEAVRRYAAYEQATLETVTELRVRGEQARAAGEAPAALVALESALGAGLRRLFALAESYPDLKADASFLDLQRNVSEVERHLQFARRYYNGAARALNTRIESFPDLIVARLFRFEPADYFELDDGVAVRVP
jgi:LemA protein